jgi:exopolyphosphatase/guanosine-5'-triphosphate,3'-diphosphate pyrophosphatase
MAAVDLGSNSFHMVVARAHHGQLAIVDRLREMVRLASGLSGRGRLDGESQDRALACLRRFGQRLQDMHAEQVRVVGTNTLRRAKNSEAFLAAAEEALGHPVEVIAGMEEARLVYLGVSHFIDSTTGRNLVIDIGGGSTELIIGEGYEPVQLESLNIGCVGLSQKFFEGGRLSSKRFARARLAASQELRPVAASFRRRGWSLAVGSSGTIRGGRRGARCRRRRHHAGSARGCDRTHDRGPQDREPAIAWAQCGQGASVCRGRRDTCRVPDQFRYRAPVRQ